MDKLSRYKFEKDLLKKMLGGTYNVLKENNAILAGGAITSLFTRKPINDFDIYFRNETDAVNMLRDGGSVHSFSKKAVMLGCDGNMVQLIYFNYFADAHEIFKSFDFTINMGAFDFTTEEFVFHEDFFLHNTKRMLRFNPETAFPIVSALRIEKYTTRGFVIPATDNTSVMLACMNLKIDTWGEFKEQAGGMYGTNMDEVFNFADDEPFDLDKAISIVREMELYEGDLKDMMIDRLNEEGNIFSNDKDNIAYRMTSSPIEFLEFNDKFYGFNNDKYVVTLEDRELIKGDDKVMSAKEFFKGRKVYKHVEKDDGGNYFSFYNNSFMYELGKETFPNISEFKRIKEKQSQGLYIPSNEELYFYLRGDILDGYYKDGNNKAILECTVHPEELSSIHGDNKLAFLRCIPVREVSEAFIKGEEEGDFGFTNFNQGDNGEFEIEMENGSTSDSLSPKTSKPPRKPPCMPMKPREDDDMPW